MAVAKSYPNRFTQSLYFSWSRSHARWGTPPRRVSWLAGPGNLFSWGEYSPCESLWTRGLTHLAGVIKSKFRQSPPKKTANHYQCGEFFWWYQLQNLKILSTYEVDSAYNNFLSVETDSQGDQLNQSDV